MDQLIEWSKKKPAQAGCHWFRKVHGYKEAVFTIDTNGNVYDKTGKVIGPINHTWFDGADWAGPLHIED